MKRRLPAASFFPNTKIIGQNCGAVMTMPDLATSGGCISSKTLVFLEPSDLSSLWSQNAIHPADSCARRGSNPPRPDERLGLVVGFCDEAVDCGLQLDDRCEDAAFEPVPGELGKQALDGVGPGARSRGEVEGEALMPLQPGFHPGVLVSGVVVENHVDRFAGRHLALDGIEKADELLMSVALHTAPDDLAFQDIEGGEQSGGAVALVIVGHGGAAPLLHWQPG